MNDYVIVSKPCGMTMHHNPNAHSRWGMSKSPVLQTAIRRQLSRKPYLVHRLDHRTSGACVMGFTSDAALKLHGRLGGDGATKLYVALVRGDLRGRFRRAASTTAPACDRIDDDEGRENCADGNGRIIESQGKVPDAMALTGGGEGRRTDGSSNDDDEYGGKITVNLPIKVKVGGIEIEKDALTDFYFLSSMSADDDDDDDVDDDAPEDGTMSTTARYVNKSLTLLLCHPRTGRTHQIRRHQRKALMSPVIGDVEHGDSCVNRHWRKSISDRLGLHCWYLRLPPEASSSSPPDDGVIECLAPLTLDFAGPLKHEKLGPLWAEACRVEPRLGMEPYDERGGTFGRNYRKRR
ncbi:hypothetical protein ACHAW5_005952 [Stephanodiscus triporus]|uniref:Pseudouridine synthase RsuA/RluA-like domain-containing protein n=1 Tax=Stephanodiscus triporus TaxID=2934178 RepID=A0ABD3QX03_9STRA